jgi:murein DD-endopeptidase MepM/ murein hydrolase activator NlpD
MQERDVARSEAIALDQAQTEIAAASVGASPHGNEMLDVISTALSDTAAERDQVIQDAQSALRLADEMRLELALMEEKNDQIFRQLEDAMTISVEPLEKMFSSAGLSTKTLMDEVRRGYTGQGGPMMPLNFATKGGELTSEALRTNRLLDQLDQLNVYRIAAETAPFANPLQSSFRYTSGFGMRWGRMHKGTDFAAPYGTPIHVTAEGTVTHAGWQSGYGRLIKVRHANGIETRYAHLAKIRVKVGQKVSRGAVIGDMGNSGRSTGTHLHYEVRVNGRAINPMTFIKAGQDVF